jgi:hypothetical protein
MKHCKKRADSCAAQGTGRRIVRFGCRCTGKLFLFALITFIVTFCIYMFNLENKLLYYVVRPFLNRHYNAQTRDRRI